MFVLQGTLTIVVLLHALHIALSLCANKTTMVKVPCSTNISKVPFGKSSYPSLLNSGLSEWRDLRSDQPEGHRPSQSRPASQGGYSRVATGEEA